MKEYPKGNAVIVPTSAAETPDHLIMRIFGMTAREYAEKLLREHAQTHKADKSAAA